MRLKLTGLWRHADFLRLWAGQTISVFGSMIGGTALSFTAILFLQATPFQLGVLSAMQIVPALLAGLFAGAWVDRLRRRPLLIGADIGRALVLASLPLSALLGMLHIGQVYGVALLVSILTIIFDVSYQAYLPALVGKDELVEGNSKLSASAAVAEFGGFSIAGWLVQALTAPFAILIDAVSFGVSAITLGLIRSREAEVIPAEHPDMFSEIGDGLQAVRQNALLRAMAAAVFIEGSGRRHIRSAGGALHEPRAGLQSRRAGHDLGGWRGQLLHRGGAGAAPHPALRPRPADDRRAGGNRNRIHVHPAGQRGHAVLGDVFDHGAARRRVFHGLRNQPAQPGADAGAGTPVGAGERHHALPGAGGSPAGLAARRAAR